MEVNRHTILLTGHFNNLARYTRALNCNRHKGVETNSINRHMLEFVYRIISKNCKSFIYSFQYVDYLRYFNETFHNIHRKKLVNISKNLQHLELQILLI